MLHEFGLPAALRWLGEQMKRFELTVSVRIECPEEQRLPEDRAILLFQSTRELLINTAKHAGTKEATVTLAQHDGTLCITVQDQGIGFDPTIAQKPGSTVGSSKFGLFSIRERMFALGGHFEIHSTGGKGTTAILSLPRELGSILGSESAPLSSRSYTLDIADPQMHLGISCRVLIVDDHAMVRQGLRSLLDTYNDIHVVGEAANGSDAVELTERLKPSIVLMDINMPGMNGIDATAKIKTCWPEIMVIGLSVNATAENVDAMKTAGATLLMTKEAAVDELHGAIQQALKGSVSCSL